MNRPSTKIKEWSNVNQESFINEIQPLGKPAIFRGFVNHWPIVKKSQESDSSVKEYLEHYDNGVAASTWLAPPEINGKFFYNEELNGLNFNTKTETVTDALKRVFEHMKDDNPPAIFAGSVKLNECMPSLQNELPCPWIGTTVPARIWIGNAVTVQTHYDNTSNIACVATGKRRFTLFPPNQVSNLYPGPIEFTPAGTPVSMVKLHAPDLVKYPNFGAAMNAAEFSELEPGDAIYIPPLWWHHVESLARFNVLVNYWWDGFQVVPDAPFTCLAHGLMSIRSLPETDRQAWKAMFDHYVFKTQGDPAAHLDPKIRGMLGDLTPETFRAIKEHFISSYQADQEPRN